MIIYTFLNKLGDIVIDAMNKQLEGLTFEESSKEDEEEEEKELFFRNENDLDNIDNEDEPTKTEVPLAHLQKSMMNLVELPMRNEVNNEKANNIEQNIKAFAKAYVKVNK
ncbi:hypothetical protein L1987_85841 [Smallanthus sonchifolius]|uniref:Uncharacterized protein n=1 Tax=Smallanthus sonchifolius TaxID=185202 RepID=A0ACB8XWZ3_9ASTR|nr:hypothetical protein L1987_85841 [Smallanthus sonchifolius]